MAALSRERFWVSLLLFSLHAVAHAADRFAPIREAIRQQLLDKSLPSIAIAVVQDGRIVWEEGFGWADRERRVAATAHTPYSLASVTKPLTATAVMTLVRDGKLNLDAPVSAYLGPGMLRAHHGQVEQVTSRLLLNHTSGLGEYHRSFVRDAPAMRDELQRHGELLAAPGERFQYSNLGYGALQEIIARLAGVSFADYVRREVFSPLGMRDSSIGRDSERAARSAARYGADGLPLEHYELSAAGSGSAYASAHDLARFALFHLGRKLQDQREILSPALRQQMRESTFSYRPNEYYGLGWDMDDTPSGQRFVGHRGGMAGVSTTLTLVPSAGIAVVVLTNSAAGTDIGERIVGLLLPQQVPDSVRPNVVPFSAGTDLLGEWQGSVHTGVTQVPLRLRILPSGDVGVRLGEQFETLLARINYRDRVLDGRFNGILRIPGADTENWQLLRLSLQNRGDVLDGGMFAEHSGVSCWVELRRSQPNKSVPGHVE